MKINVKGIRMFLYEGGLSITPLVPTAISSANPPLVSVPDASGLVSGMPVTFNNTGFDELDGGTFVVGEVDELANTFTVLGADTTNTTGVISASPEAILYPDGDRVRLCLNSLEIAAPSVNQIDVSTYCEESTMPGRTTAGQVTMGGFVENNSAALAEIMRADEDGLERIFLIEMPSGQGYMIGAITFAGLGYTVPLEGAVGYTISGTQSQKIRYMFQ